MNNYQIDFYKLFRENGKLRRSLITTANVSFVNPITRAALDALEINVERGLGLGNEQKFTVESEVFQLIKIEL